MNGNRDDCLPNSKKFKMLRYQEPPPFWGPKSKPKRKNEDNDDDDESEQKDGLKEKVT